MDRIDVSVANLKASIADIFAAYPELAEDESLALDTLEGETNLFEIVSYLVKKKCENDAFSQGLKEYINDLSARKARHDRNSEGYKKLILSLMTASGVNKILLSEATISRLKGRQKVVVKDVNELPQGYYKTKREADLTAIKESLENGEEIPGAYFEFSQDSVAIRIK